jgi:hypothetical protein
VNAGELLSGSASLLNACTPDSKPFAQNRPQPTIDPYQAPVQKTGLTLARALFITSLSKYSTQLLCQHQQSIARENKQLILKDFMPT